MSLQISSLGRNFTWDGVKLFSSHITSMVAAREVALKYNNIQIYEASTLIKLNNELIFIFT